jgi:hypothetical protein
LADIEILLFEMTSPAGDARVVSFDARAARVTKGCSRTRETGWIGRTAGALGSALAVKPSLKANA